MLSLSLVALLSAACSNQPELTLRNLSQPQEGIVCSGQPTEDQFDSLKDHGITRVIHLRQAKEKGTGWEEERAKTAGVEFVRLEIAGKDGLTKENVQRFHDLMQKKTAGKTLVSCGSSNRVGALFALKGIWHDNMPREEAIALGKKSGMKSLAPVVEAMTAK